MDWLKPFMTKSQCKKGDVLFAKDAIADAMYYTVSGRYRLTELGIEIGPGQLIGELGMLAPSNRRTASFECIEDGVLLSVTYSQVEELYYQNPSFGFYFLRDFDRAPVRQYFTAGNKACATDRCGQDLNASISDRAVRQTAYLVCNAKTPSQSGGGGLTLNISIRSS